jgi:hypothetical protein
MPRSPKEKREPRRLSPGEVEAYIRDHDIHDVVLGIDEYPGLTIIHIGDCDLNRQVRGAQRLLGLPVTGLPDDWLTEHATPKAATDTAIADRRNLSP